MAVFAAAMFAITFVVGMADRSISSAVATGSAGSLELVSTSAGTSGSPEPIVGGGSSTQFNLRLPTGAACSGDSASGGYRYQTFVVPVEVDPSTLTFGLTGPAPFGTGAELRVPLYDLSGTPIVNGFTDLAASAGGPGTILNIPPASFAVFEGAGIEVMPPGTYDLGVACTVGPPGPGQLDRFWHVEITVSADPSDAPGGLAFVVGDGPVATTTTEPPSTATTEPSTTTTTEPATTTTTTTSSAPTTSSTTEPPTTSTTSIPDETTTTLDDTTSTLDDTTTTTTDPAVGVLSGGVSSGGASGAASPASSSGTLPYTGAPAALLAAWGFLFLVSGAVAAALGRGPDVPR